MSKTCWTFPLNWIGRTRDLFKLFFSLDKIILFVAVACTWRAPSWRCPTPWYCRSSLAPAWRWCHCPPSAAAAFLAVCTNTQITYSIRRNTSFNIKNTVRYRYDQKIKKLFTGVKRKSNMLWGRSLCYYIGELLTLTVTFSYRTIFNFRVANFKLSSRQNVKKYFFKFYQ